VAEEEVLLGTVVPLKESEVASGAAGKVLEFPRREGDFVEAGDTLAVLRSVTLRIEIDAAKADADAKKARWEQLSTRKKSEIDQAEAARDAAKADHDYAKARLKRTVNLYERGTLNKDDLQRDQSAFDRAAAKLQEAEATLRLTDSLDKAIAQAHAEYLAQEQEVARLEDELKKRTINAPFSGYITETHAEVGQWVEKGGTVVDMVDLSAVDVSVNVEESHMHLVKKGEPVLVLFDALGGAKYTGTLREIVPRSDWEGGSRSFPVKVRIENKRDGNGLPELKEGMLARIVLRGPLHEALLVPKDAVVRSSGRSVVFKLDAEDRAVNVPIEEHLSYGNFVEASGDLQPGDRLVTEGNERLRPAQKVAILKSDPADRAGGAPAGAKSQSAEQASSQNPEPAARS